MKRNIVAYKYQSLALTDGGSELLPEKMADQAKPLNALLKKCDRFEFMAEHTPIVHTFIEQLSSPKPLDFPELSLDNFG